MNRIASLEEYNKALNENINVLIDFYADWCGPCKHIIPILETFATNNSEKIKVFKINVDDEFAVEIAKTYQVRSVPTLIWFKQHSPVFTHRGVISENDLVRITNTYTA